MRLHAFLNFSGIVMLDEEDNEESVRNSIRESVIKKLPIISPNDFEFVKVQQKKITRLELGLTLNTVTLW